MAWMCTCLTKHNDDASMKVRCILFDYFTMHCRINGTCHISIYRTRTHKSDATSLLQSYSQLGTVTASRKITAAGLFMLNALAFTKPTVSKHWMQRQIFWQPFFAYWVEVYQSGEWTAAASLSCSRTYNNNNNNRWYLPSMCQTRRNAQVYNNHTSANFSNY